MDRKLLTVEDTFLITGRGLIVVPGIPEQRFGQPCDLDVELRRPDGSARAAVLSIVHTFQSPPPREYRHTCLFRELAREDVPIGTEIWYASEDAL